MQRYDIINKFITKYNFLNYLEIGVFTGQCFREVVAQHKDGVDPGTESGVAAEVNYPMTSDDFFTMLKGSNIKYDIIFLDGLHHSDQVDKDIQNCLEHLQDYGIIVIHDCNPEKEEYTLVPRVSGIWHGDVYKSILRFRKSGIHTFFTIDTDCGCGVIIKDNKKIENVNVENFDRALVDWNYFYDNKQTLLNLISVEQFNKEF